MPDSDKNIPKNIEKPEKDEETPKETIRPEEKEVSEAKISVGLEAGEIIEGAEVITGEVSEKERKAKERYAGKAGSGAIKAAKKRIPKPPTVPVMKKEVKVQLKKEIKQLNKKIKKVIRKQGDLEAYQLNNLMKKLRKFQEILSSLAYATREMIKELWVKYVKEHKSLR